ncbi:MAG: mechanosensitive ion channel family protein [bacterium]|nr:mechanosensitive ion channel family protein [bacterium]
MEELRNVLLDSEKVLTASRAVILFLAGLVVARLVSRLVARLVSARLEPQQALLLRRFLSYGLVALFTVAALHELGFNLGVLLGAAGVLSVAAGFASQTSASNLVSGLFLIVEKPFAIGDVIEIGGTTGEVLAIDLLSVKLRTFDNKFVRIPNESVIKSEVSTLTKFPIRRVDLQIGVAYREDLERVRDVLMEVADRNLLCLDEPKPVLFFQGFGDSSIDFQFSVWATRENFVELKNTIQLGIKKAFDREGIEIPFPQRVLHAGGGAKSFPVEVVESPDGSEDPDDSRVNVP